MTMPSGPDSQCERAVTRALVLAAGRSTRIEAIAQDLPKPLIEVAGATALDWNLRWLAAEGVVDVWINLHHKAEAIRSHVGDGSQYGLRVRYSFEPEILGTAGAVRRLERELSGEPFLVLYGDNVTRTSLRALVDAHREGGAAITIGMFDFRTDLHSGIAGGRVVVDPQNVVREFHEGADHESPWVNAGVYVVDPSVFESLPPDGVYADFGKDVLPQWVRSGRTVLGFPIDGFCFGIDTPEAWERANERLLAKGKHP